MRALGDDYVKAGTVAQPKHRSRFETHGDIPEFRRHQKVTNPVHIMGFLSQWKMYLDEIPAGPEGAEYRGRKLDPTKFEKMTNEQLGQLYKIEQRSKGSLSFSPPISTMSATVSSSVAPYADLPPVNVALFEAKAKKGLTFADIGKALNRDEVWVAAAFYAQAKFNDEEISKLSELLGFGEQYIASEIGSHWWPNRGLGDMPPKDPVIYRLYEGVMVYGHSIKWEVLAVFSVVDGLGSRSEWQYEKETNAMNGSQPDVRAYREYESTGTVHNPTTPSWVTGRWSQPPTWDSQPISRPILEIVQQYSVDAPQYRRRADQLLHLPLDYPSPQARSINPNSTSREGSKVWHRLLRPARYRLLSTPPLLEFTHAHARYRNQRTLTIGCVQRARAMANGNSQSHPFLRVTAKPPQLGNASPYSRSALGTTSGSDLSSLLSHASSLFDKITPSSTASFQSSQSSLGYTPLPSPGDEKEQGNKNESCGRP
ncbi:hypothetical protein NMY22_g18351 [Coprinellus aureogranulatus]|nr:hypothetical protein NMY22_g18351 [Coprinellus aureogranulatus]